jgi:hypothetical protein
MRRAAGLLAATGLVAICVVLTGSTQSGPPEIEPAAMAPVSSTTLTSAAPAAVATDSRATPAWRGWPPRRWRHRLGPTRWRPAAGADWQIQLDGSAIDTSVNVPTYLVDMFGTDASTVATLHSLGRHALCYVDVGSAEDYRPDYSSFPASVMGNTNGWPGERWLDIRQLSVLRPIMANRLDQCKAKGFDGVYPDLMDGFNNSTGFPLTAADQITYNKAIADLAHARGLAIGLNDLVQSSTLEPYFDFALNEQCVQYNECNYLTAFPKAGKAVLHIEYSKTPSQFCPITVPMGFSSLQKHTSLDAWRATC